MYTKRQRQLCDNAAMTLAILFSLKSMESLENGLQTQSGATPLISMRTESQASSQRCRRVDADAWCKRALSYPFASFNSCYRKDNVVMFIYYNVTVFYNNNINNLAAK